LFDELYQKYRDTIAKDALVIVEGGLRFDEFSNSWRLAARRITDLHRAREQRARRLVLRLAHREEPGQAVARLEEILTPWRGGPCAIAIEYTGASAAGTLTLPAEWNVKPAHELLERLEAWVGPGGLQVVYGSPAASASLAESGPRP